MSRILVNLVAVLVLLVTISLVTVVPSAIGELVLPPLKSTGFDQIRLPYTTPEKWFIGMAVELVTVVALIALKILWPPLTTQVENWLWDLHWLLLKLRRWCRREGRPIYRVWRRK